MSEVNLDELVGRAEMLARYFKGGIGAKLIGIIDRVGNAMDGLHTEENRTESYLMLDELESGLSEPYQYMLDSRNQDFVFTAQTLTAILLFRAQVNQCLRTSSNNDYNILAFIGETILSTMEMYRERITSLIREINKDPAHRNYQVMLLSGTGFQYSWF